MEDYKEKYKQALERAKNYHKGHTLDVNPQAAMEYVFPELKESEDERIREELIRDIDIAMPLETAQRYIAWLKKQGEKTTKWSEEDEVMLDEIIDFFENGTVKLQHDLSLYASWLKSLKERYTWKPSDKQIQTLEFIVEYHVFANKDRREDVIALLFDLKKLKEE